MARANPKSAISTRDDHSFSHNNSKICSRDKLIARFQDALSETRQDLLMQITSDHAMEVLRKAPCELIGLGALSCIRTYSQTVVSNFLNILIAAEDMPDATRAVTAMIEEAMRLLEIDRVEAYERFYKLSMECGIFSAIVAGITEAWLESHNMM